MTEYVHPEVTTREYEDGNTVGLIIVACEGERAAVKDAIDRYGGSIEESVFDMFKVRVPSNAVDDLVEMDIIRSISADDISMEDLTPGNLRTHQA